jgi:1,2-diacylglycerol 3-alpha-glucosyltransferase
MKIAQVCHRYHPYIGGVETHVREISERLSKKGFQVDILTTDPSRRLSAVELLNNISVRRFHSWAPANSYHFSLELRKYLKENSNKYDIVHVHSYHDIPAYYASIGKKTNKLFFTPHYHGAGQILSQIFL